MRGAGTFHWTLPFAPGHESGLAGTGKGVKRVSKRVQHERARTPAKAAKENRKH
ncbi:hypothetical protein X907_0242 [Glycocaulis alkaliphilus]|uniref:Uncharacterized protein n=1 Tax=Glycocaulis alkaliphilus TaxID=1434191 RepID=A0A3T0E5Z0_9PROT|nr:hypothetical protein X907_0242 [Glycocaulis alkaliphilus]